MALCKTKMGNVKPGVAGPEVLSLVAKSNAVGGDHLPGNEGGLVGQKVRHLHTRAE